MRPQTTERAIRSHRGDIKRLELCDLDVDRKVTALDFDLNPDVIWEDEILVEEGNEPVLALNY